MDSTTTASSTPSSTSSHTTVARPQGRGLILFGAVGVALISTVAAYWAMVGYGRDVLEMGPINAYAFAGVFELSLVTVALMAREAAQHARPAPVLLGLTWVLSATSGFFAGWHEIYLGHPTPAAAFRFIVPLLAALMWHLALIGDRHLAMGTNWRDRLAEFAEKRKHARMEISMNATEKWFRALAIASSDPSKKSRQAVKRANEARIQAQRDVRKAMKPAEVADQITAWTDLVRAQALGTRTVGEVVTAEIRHTTGVQLDLAEILDEETALAERVAASMRQELVTADAAVEEGDDPAEVVTDPLAAAGNAPAELPSSTTDLAETPTAEAVPAAETEPSAAAADASAQTSATTTDVPHAQPRVEPRVEAEPEPASSAGDTSTYASSTAPAPRRAARPRTRDDVDPLEVDLRRKANESYESIGKAMGFSRDTVRRAHREWQKSAPQTPAHGLQLVTLETKH